jgi:hypothetical protein
LERVAFRAIMGVSARAISLADRSQRAIRVTSVRMRRASRKSGGGGGGNFDGAWVVVAVGTTCSGGSTTAFVVNSGRVIGEGVTGR